MKLDLKNFQKIAAEDIMARLQKAREAVAEGDLEAIVLSAPTGSGKTITLAQVIDCTFGGGDDIVARPDTIFLWLSDSPELNVQSKNKLVGACDHLPYYKMVTIESENFKDDELHPGHVYFINTQLLGRDKLLTKENGGDFRNTTFWRTVAATIARRPQDFILIIDEAHRGATATDRNRMTIMQKFILGSPPDGLPPVPLVLGMSATPQRFMTLLGNANRTQRPINIDPEHVRLSGLLKDLILVHSPRTNTPGDLTLLAEAARVWKRFAWDWKTYCAHEREKDVVRPILVVQVEDGTATTLTNTRLEDVVRVIEKETEPLATNEIVHCFQDSADISIGGRIIRKIEQSRIQDDPDVRVVLFKTALSTGWDCPRAEVMMSFRRAEDPTSIAQLVGRMVRTPLARRIETNESLDTVELFLPHFNHESIQQVLTNLRNPTEGLGVRAETAAATYPRNPKFAAVFNHLATLPKCSIDRMPRMGEVKRALRLAGLLMHEGLNQDADDLMRKPLINKLGELHDAYKARVDGWTKTVNDAGEIEIDSLKVVTGPMTIDLDGTTTSKLKLSEENIEQLFDAAGRLLAAGEGLHHSYWKTYQQPDRPSVAKLELIGIMRQPETMATMEKFAGEQFRMWWKKYETKVRQLPASIRQKFYALIHSSGKAVSMPWDLPEQIVEKLPVTPSAIRGKHLYCDQEGRFPVELNSWEEEILGGELKKQDVVCWLRNFDRREWAFCVPYEMGGIQPFYPDFVIIRKSGDGLITDIVETHNPSWADTVPKAIGMARFAEEHGKKFGRLIVACKNQDRWHTFDVNDKFTRENILRKIPGSTLLE